MSTNLLESPLLWTLISLLGVYLLEIAIFAAVYYRLYQADPSHFVFNSDVLRGQIRSFLSFARNQIRTLNDQIARLQSLCQELKSQEIEPSLYEGAEHSTSELTLKGMRFKLERGSYSTELQHVTVCVLAIQLEDGSPIHRIPIPFGVGSLPENSTEFREFAMELIDHLTTEAAGLEQRVATAASEKPDVWSYWDFFYFSFIT